MKFKKGENGNLEAVKHEEKKEEKKALAQSESVPACNSHTHPKCKDAVTSAPEHLAPLWS